MPGGDMGVWMALRNIRRYVRDAVADRLVIETAQSIVKGCAQRDDRCEALTLRKWLAKNFRFVRDPVRQETLRSPRAHLEQLKRDGVVSGDCDDAAVLGASLAAALGFEPYAVVTGYRRAGAPFQHIITMLPLDDNSTEWLDLDVTRPAGQAPAVTRSMSWKLT